MYVVYEPLYLYCIYINNSCIASINNLTKRQEEFMCRFKVCCTLLTCISSIMQYEAHQTSWVLYDSVFYELHTVRMQKIGTDTHNCHFHLLLRKHVPCSICEWFQMAYHSSERHVAFRIVCIPVSDNPFLPIFLCKSCGSLAHFVKDRWHMQAQRTL